MKNQVWRKGCASVALGAMMQPGFVLAQSSHTARTAPSPRMVTIAPKSSDAVQKYVIKSVDELNLADEIKLYFLRQKIKYVFVLFQENRSFDFYFGSYPGANGLYSQPPSATPGFTQPIVDAKGNVTTITPFKIPLTVQDVNGKTVPIYPADTDSVNHSHAGYETKIDVQNGVTLNDGYALTEEGVTLVNGVPNKLPAEGAVQKGELVMGHIDCDTAPIMWSYADRFTLFDDFHQTVLSASTPNAIAMIAGQSGETQWVKHPDESTLAVATAAGNPTNIGANGVPVVSDGDPYWGSQLDMTGSGQPANPPSKTPNPNLTFATLPLSFMGSDINTITQQDKFASDLTDVEKDITEIAGSGVKPTNWGWYQQGYDKELDYTAAGGLHADYIPHHNAPQYFGYVSNNPEVTSHLHGLTDFASDVYNHKLPADGGVFYVRGGYNNIEGLTPVDPNPALATVFNGSDDHPGYSDLQIANALLADEINLITASGYWDQSAIIITYDETDGLYDHAPEVIRSYDPFGEPLDQGPRIPTIVLSPYSVVHAISHEPSEHSSIIKFIDLLFGLTPLADLPDEAQARIDGQSMFGQSNLGPADDHVAGVGNLFSAFDDLRLIGLEPALPAIYAQVPESLVTSFPQANNQGCSLLGITPTDANLPNPVPVDFNPRPTATPGIPTSGTWTP